jgi:hypothetical protein
VTPVPSEWVGPPVGMPTFPGFPGLFGLMELNNVQLFGSARRVPLDLASRALTFNSEAAAVERVKSMGYSTWPEFEMIVGGDGSNIVLDKLHLRNVVLKHMNVVYGGGLTHLENVTFLDCTFQFVQTELAIQLSDLILQRQAVTVSL